MTSESRIKIIEELFDSAELQLTEREKNFLTDCQNVHRDSIYEVSSSLFSVKSSNKSAIRLSNALGDNTKVLRLSNEAMKENSKNLANWTKVLAFATIILAVSSLIQLAIVFGLV